MRETDWHAHFRCTWCNGLKARGDIMHIDDKPICRHGDCKDRYDAANRPRPVPKSQARWEHG